MRLINVRMPGEDGISATQRVLASLSPPRVLMLTTFDLDQYVCDSLREGACGFLLKDMPGEDIVNRRSPGGQGIGLAAGPGHHPPPHPAVRRQPTRWRPRPHPSWPP